MTPDALLAAYDDQLRTDAETAGADRVEHLGPLRLATFRADTRVRHAEWKARGHDDAPGPHEALLDHGFEPEESESVMLGELRTLAVDVPVPEGVVLRRVTDERDVCAMQAEAFGAPPSDGMVLALLRRLAEADSTELSRPILERAGLVKVTTTTPYARFRA